MKMLSNRTGGLLPALIFAVMFALGLSAQKVQAQNNYQDNYQNYGNGDYSNGNYDNGDYDNGNYQEFYDDLSPYGQWFNDPQYGYVWAPNNVGNDFRPYYSNGQWAMTEYGNTWVSNYDWGWAPFHYGRWAQGTYGWIWIPGRTWGPAWVNWRQGGGYYGWAPMGPGISINISFGGGYNVPNPWWTFIPCGNIYSQGWQRYYSPRRTVNIINNTTIINNTYVDARSRNTYITGPRRSDIEAVTRQRVNIYNVSNRTRAGATNISGRTVNVYRPSIERSAGRGQAIAAPRQVKTLDRSVITNAGGGRAPSRAAVAPQQQGNNGRIDRSNQQREAVRTQQNVERATQSQRGQQAEMQRNTQLQRDQQVQQQRVQRDQFQRDQQAQQQRVQRDQVQLQRAQQMEQQRVQRSQQMQQEQNQQRVQRDQVQQQRAQQMEQQRVQRSQQMQQEQNQQMQQQRMQQQQQMQQQRVQQQQQQQQQRVERQAPPQRIERSAPAEQPQRMERSAERAPRGR